MQDFKVFYSFQSENESSKKAIRKSLEKAVKAFRKKNINLTIVVGAHGYAGMADIPYAIEHNIAECDIFVADLTPTSSSAGRINPNSNVLFEFGQAKAHLGDSRTIGLVLHDPAQWDIKDMPFDFNKNRLLTFVEVEDLNIEKAIEACIHYIVDPKSRKKEDVKEKREAEILAQSSHPVDSAVFFCQRMAMAFPGLRGLHTITDEDQIRQSLEILLAPPLYFNRSEGESGDTDPIWILRGNEGLHIDRFAYLGDRHFLIGWDVFNIKSLTVFRHSGLYYKEYVLINADPDEPTGLYDISEEWKAECLQSWGYVHEEYGVYTDNKQKEHLISRTEYDDDAAMIDGKIVTGLNADLRVRYITPVNYLLTAKYSAFNIPKFCHTSESLFNGLINKSLTIEQFHEYLMSFPKPIR